MEGNVCMCQKRICVCVYAGSGNKELNFVTYFHRLQIFRDDRHFQHVYM